MAIEPSVEAVARIDCAGEMVKEEQTRWAVRPAVGRVHATVKVLRDRTGEFGRLLKLRR
jgi:hypothetical protein